MIVWRIRGKTIGTVLCCVVYNDSCTQEQFFKMSVGCRFRFSFFVRLFRFSILCFSGLVYTILFVLFALCGVSFLRNDLFCVEWNVKS